MDETNSTIFVLFNRDVSSLIKKFFDVFELMTRYIL